MNKQARVFFIKEIDEALNDTNKLLSDINSSSDNRVEKHDEIQAILNDLHKIKSQLITNSMPNKNFRFVSYEEFILDSWGIRHPLGSKLLNIASKYTSNF